MTTFFLFVSICINAYLLIKNSSLYHIVKQQEDTNSKLQNHSDTLQKKIYEMSDNIIREGKRVSDKICDLRDLNNELINRISELKEEIQKLESENEEYKHLDSIKTKSPYSEIIHLKKTIENIVKELKESNAENAQLKKELEITLTQK